MKPILIEGEILKCQVHCLTESSIQLEELGIPGADSQYEWKTFYIEIKSIVAIGEYEQPDKTVSAIYTSSGDCFIVDCELADLLDIWRSYKTRYLW